MKRNLPYIALVPILLVIDQLTKLMISKNIPYGTNQIIIPGFFNLSHVRNKGGIFGIFSQSGNSTVFVLLTLASLIALILVIYYFVITPTSEPLLKFTLTLIMAGALGNLLDRILRGYVIDFLDFYIGKNHFPSFNVADSCITIGAILLIYTFFIRKGGPNVASAG